MILESKLRKFQSIAESQKMTEQRKDKKFFEIIEGIINHRRDGLEEERKRHVLIIEGQRQVTAHINSIFNNANCISSVLRYVEKMICEHFDEDVTYTKRRGILIEKLKSPAQTTRDVDIIVGKIVQCMIVHNLIMDFYSRSYKKIHLSYLFDKANKDYLKDIKFFDSKFIRKLLIEFEFKASEHTPGRGRPKNQAKPEIVDNVHGLTQDELDARAS